MAEGTKVGTGYVDVKTNKKDLQGELELLGQSLGGRFGKIGSLLGNQLGGKMGEGVNKNLGGPSSGIVKLSGMLGKAGPWGVAAGTAVAAGAAIGVGLYKLGSDFASQYRTIQRATGATGKDMDALKGTFKSVASNTSASFGQVSEAIIEVQRYTGPTGKDLGKLSGQFLTLSRITKTDVKTNVEAGTHALEQWNLRGPAASQALNQLYTASQKSGVSFGDLAGQVTKFAPQMRTMGFSFSSSTAMIAQFGKMGVNTPRVMQGMQRAAAQLAKEQTTVGKEVTKAREAVKKANDAQAQAAPGSAAYRKATDDVAKSQLGLKSALSDQAKVAGNTLPREFDKTIKSIKGAKTETDAINIASGVFGTRGAVQMVDAIRTGKFNFDEMSKAVKGSGDSIADMAKKTPTLSGSFGKLKNATKVALEPLSTATFKAINTGLIDMAKWAMPVVTWFGQNLPGAMKHTTNAIKDVIRAFEVTYDTISGWVRTLYEVTKPIRQSIGAAFTQLGRVVNDFWNLVKPIFDAFTDVFKVIIDLFTGKWGAAWNAVKDFVKHIGQALMAVPKLLFDWITLPFASIGPKVQNAIHTLWDFITTIPGKIGSYLAGVAPAVWNAMVTGFHQAVAGATSGVSAIWGWVKGIAGRVLNGFGNLGGAVVNAFRTGFTRAVSGATAGINAIWGWTKGIAKRVVSGWANIGTLIYNSFRSGFQRILSGAKDGASALWSWTSGLGKSVVSSVGDMGSKLFNAGKNLVQGFVNGITSLPGIIKDKLVSLIPGPLKHFAGALGLGSPSRIFYGFGENVVQGFVNGLTDMAPQVGAAMMKAIPSVVATGISSSALNATALAPTSGTSLTGGPAVYIENATFTDGADLEMLMKKAAFAVNSGQL